MTTNSVISISYHNNIGNKFDKKYKFLERKWLKELLESAELQLQNQNNDCVEEIKKGIYNLHKQKKGKCRFLIYKIFAFYFLW